MKTPAPSKIILDDSAELTVTVGQPGEEGFWETRSQAVSHGTAYYAGTDLYGYHSPEVYFVCFRTIH